MAQRRRSCFCVAPYAGHGKRSDAESCPRSERGHGHWSTTLRQLESLPRARLRRRYPHIVLPRLCRHVDKCSANEGRGKRRRIGKAKKRQQDDAGSSRHRARGKHPPMSFSPPDERASSVAGGRIGHKRGRRNHQSNSAMRAAGTRERSPGTRGRPPLSAEARSRRALGDTCSPAPPCIPFPFQ